MTVCVVKVVWGLSELSKPKSKVGYFMDPKNQATPSALRNNPQETVNGATEGGLGQTGAPRFLAAFRSILRVLGGRSHSPTLPTRKSRHFKRVCGFYRRLRKRAMRVFEWAQVVWSEVGAVGVVKVVSSVAAAGVSAGRAGAVTDLVWARRMRVCRGCPVFDATRHACRDRQGLGLGCGCWMPVKARVGGNQCWRRGLDGGGHPE